MTAKKTNLYIGINYEKPITTYFNCTTTFSDEVKRQMSLDQRIVLARNEMDTIVVGLFPDKQKRIKIAQMIENLKRSKVKPRKEHLRKIKGYLLQLNRISQQLGSKKVMFADDGSKYSRYTFAPEFHLLNLLNGSPSTIDTLLEKIKVCLDTSSQPLKTLELSSRRGPDSSTLKYNLIVLSKAFKKSLLEMKIKGEITSLQNLKLDDRNKSYVNATNLTLLSCMCVGLFFSEDRLKSNLSLKKI